MPYDIKNYKGASIASILEGTVNTQTSLNLVGQNYKNYGQLIAENFMHIIENFARDMPPTNASVGQLWYKPKDGHLYILDQDVNNKTKWKSLATLEIQSTDPAINSSGGGYTPREGDFWFNSASDKGILNIRYKDDETGVLKWGQLSVPVSSDATLFFKTVQDDTGNANRPPKGHGTIQFVVDNRVLAIFSSAEKEWTPLKEKLGVSSGGTLIEYEVELHPDFTPLHKSFPLIQAGLTLSSPYDPDLAVSGASIEGYVYQVQFPAPGPGGVRAEGYPVISSVDGSIQSITITNKGSGYDSNTVLTDVFVPQGQGGSSQTVPALTITLGAAGTEFEDKITSVTVGFDTNPTGSVLGGSGYYTPPIKPVLSGSVRIGAERTNYIDLRNLQAGFGRKIVDLKILNGGSGYDKDVHIITILAPTGQGSVSQATAIITDVTDGVITGVQIDSQGDGYTYAPSSANSEIFTDGSDDATFLAVLGDNRLILDPNAISGDKIHGGNISDFESSAIADNTNWQRNDPGIDGLTIEDGYTTASTANTVVHASDYALWGPGGDASESISGANPYYMTVDADSLALTRRRAGYVEVAFEREQTISSASTVTLADGAFRVLGGAHVQKNLQIEGNLSIKGNLYTGGSVTTLETSNLVIEDNLIELNKSQSDAGEPFVGVSGLFIDRGKTGVTQQPFATILWDDTNDAFSDPDFFKVGSFLGHTTNTNPEDPPVTADTVDPQDFVLGKLDTLVIQAQQGGKLDIISDWRIHDNVSTSNAPRDVGGHLSVYNGWDQDITLSGTSIIPSETYPYTAKVEQGETGAEIVEHGNDLILVDTDERIIRGEFHFYRDAYPTDGSDSLINTGVAISNGGTATGKARGSSNNSSNLLIIRDTGSITADSLTLKASVGYFKGSGGPGSVYSNADNNPEVYTDNNPGYIVSAHKDDTPETFLEDPAWWVGDGDGVVCALREGRALGWQTPRVHVHSTDSVPGTGALVMPVVSLDGTLSDATILSGGKHYTGTTPNPFCAVVGEARDTSTASTGTATNGHITVTTTGGKVSGAQVLATGSNYRSAKPFKEVNSTKFNGILCADPTQTNNSVGIGKLAKSQGLGAGEYDNTNKYVGLYPIMDGHNTSTPGTLPYDGSGMTIGYQQGHFVDAYIKNIRVENPWNAREDLTILNRATNTSGTYAKANINIHADCTGNAGLATVDIQADGGTSTTDGQASKIYMQSKSYGNTSTSQAFVEIVSLAAGDALARTDIVASSMGSGTIGQQESKVYVTAKDSKTVLGPTLWPYGQRQEIITGGPNNFEDNTRADAGNEVHVQATDMVVVEKVDSTGRTEIAPAGTAPTMTDWLTRFEVDAKDTRLNGHVHLGDGALAGGNVWDRNVYFNANISSHVFPGIDSYDTIATTEGAGWDLGATDSETRISDHHGDLTATGATDRRWRSLYVRNISAGSNSSTGTITGDWSLTSGSTFQATYTADLAERYEADAVLEAGTVVAIGGDNEVTATTTENDENVFGVVSTEPAFIMNSKAGTDETHPMVAMTGRCPCKVVGNINKGDRLVSSSTTGRARKADLTNDSVYAIIGRAIEAHDSDGEGTIEIAVTRN